jgi:hypothetical protein
MPLFCCTKCLWPLGVVLKILKLESRRHDLIEDIADAIVICRKSAIAEDKNNYCTRSITPQVRNEVISRKRIGKERGLSQSIYGE